MIEPLVPWLVGMVLGLLVVLALDGRRRVETHEGCRGWAVAESTLHCLPVQRGEHSGSPLGSSTRSGSASGIEAGT